jgi:hypothetical protein
MYGCAKSAKTGHEAQLSLSREALGTNMNTRMKAWCKAISFALEIAVYAPMHS